MVLNSYVCEWWEWVCDMGHSNHLISLESNNFYIIKFMFSECLNHDFNCLGGFEDVEFIYSHNFWTLRL